METDSKHYAALLGEIAKNQTVLVVEDDPLANKLAVNFLQKFYYRVDSAENGQLAFELYQRCVYDIVITDINMPKMNGLELCKKIREIKDNQKIVVMTAHNDSKFMQEAIRAGVNEYLFKPIDYADLLIIICRLSKQIEYESNLLEQNKLAAMGEMVSNIAHQWREPLSVLKLVSENMYLDFCANESTKESMKEQIDEIRRQTTYMSKTIDDFRNFFKQGEDQNFSLVDAINLAVSLSAAKLKLDSIDLELNCQDCRIFGNKNQLAHVLLALVSNSKDSINEKRQIDLRRVGKITISSVVQADFVLILVKDNGTGIATESMSRIFEPHFSTKHSNSGTGIGLYMVRTILERNMNGMIYGKNIDDGFEMTISIPTYKG